MDNSMNEVKVLRLEAPIVVRKVPMTEAGSTMLRRVREYQADAYYKARGVKVEIPFPVSIHMMLSDYCKLKGIPVN